MKHVVIIGNGISGITAAREIRKRSEARITVISGESAHFFSRTALMYIYMGHMRYTDTKPYADDFWAKNRIDLKQAWVKRLHTVAKLLVFADCSTMNYDVLVIASGSRTNLFGWPGQDLPGVQGLYSLQDLELMEANTKGIAHAVIVGGGLIGVEMAEMLRSRKISVTFLVREGLFWGGILPKQEAALIGRHIEAHGVEVRYRTELAEVLAGADGRVRGVRTKSGEEIACQFVGITTGVSPNIAFLHDSGIACDRGVLVNEHLETNVPDVFAVGDCAQFHQHPDPDRRPIEQVWYTGRMMGATVARTITGTRTAYAPGQWFNSAKFFDIEYQTYGWVRNTLGADEAEHYWEHPGGRIAIHFVWKKGDRRFVGVNAFGLRLRHEVFDRWLNERATIEQVMANLHEAHFDPEFFTRYEAQIQATFQEERVEA
jgi:NADPH-dependent 2,4-dienoyl-CoA reductase/sulfur reductase-like enzyme